MVPFKFDLPSKRLVLSCCVVITAIILSVGIYIGHVYTTDEIVLRQKIDSLESENKRLRNTLGDYAAYTISLHEFISHSAMTIDDVYLAITMKQSEETHLALLQNVSDEKRIGEYESLSEDAIKALRRARFKMGVAYSEEHLALPDMRVYKLADPCDTSDKKKPCV